MPRATPSIQCAWKSAFPSLQSYTLPSSTMHALALPRLLFSTEGGMEIEELHAERPELVFELVIDPRHGLGSAELEVLLAPSGLETAVAGKLHTLLQKLYGLFSQWDAELLEINPLALDTAGDLVALDCKLTIDDASLSRQPDLPEARSTGTELEKTRPRSRPFLY